MRQPVSCGALVQQPAYRIVRQHPAVELLMHQLGGLAAQHASVLPQMGLELVKDSLDFPALAVERRQLQRRRSQRNSSMLMWPVRMVSISRSGWAPTACLLAEQQVNEQERPTVIALQPRAIQPACGLSAAEQRLDVPRQVALELCVYGVAFTDFVEVVQHCKRQLFGLRGHGARSTQALSDACHVAHHQDLVLFADGGGAFFSRQANLSQHRIDDAGHGLAISWRFRGAR